MKKVAIIVLLLIVNVACLRNRNTMDLSNVVLPYVVDEADVIDAGTQMLLDNKLARFRKQADMDFAVVTISTSGGESAFDHSLKLARERAASISNKNNKGNLFLLVVVDDRKWHIQISRNLEAKLTNEILTELSAPMTESFKEKRYGEGITKYVDAIIAKLGTTD
jgi:uncharacterized membrane protein YgcG